jgi:septal ring factor EnvC (AmiA/AmiB activator)
MRSLNHRNRNFPIFVALLFISSLLIYNTVFAKNITNVKKEYKEIQEKIKTHKKKLNEVRKREYSTLDELDKTNRQLNIVEKKLRKYRKKLKATKKEISTVEAEISALSKKLQDRKRWLKRRLRAMYRYGKYGSIILVLSGSEDISQLLRRWKYLEALSAYEHRMIENFREDIAALNNKKSELKQLYARLKKEERRVRQAERDLAIKKKRKKEILASVRREKATYEKMLKELKEASKRLFEIIKEAEKAEKYIAKGFRKLKGKLPWPVEGKIALPYGTHKDPRFNTPVFRNGIYIAANSGAIAKAVHRGKVVFADWFKGYGQLVILNHGGGYHTLYANLSEIFLKTGDIIERKGKIGRVGSSSVLDRPSLYFEIRYKGKPLDPVQWLRRR